MKTKQMLFSALLGLTAALDSPAQDGAVLQRLDSATAWLNSAPLDAAGLRGKVVLVDFWTYTCINWLRTLPYVRAWAGKYGDQGLVVIGVHTPEFEFEKNIDNVRRAVHDMGVAYPVAVDSEYAIWQGFGNHYWPAIYIVDVQGRVRYRHFGEGEYERAERVIQQLLAEAGKPVTVHGVAAPQGDGVEAAPDLANLRSPETYVGVERTENFASPGGAIVGTPRTYAVPEWLATNHWALAGDWTMQQRFITLNRPNGRIVYRFHSRDLHLVMGPATRGAAVRFRVLIDGKPPGAAHGIDSDEQGNGTVSEQRLYQLIRQPKPIAHRQFEIEFLDSGVEAFVFTFG